MKRQLAKCMKMSEHKQADRLLATMYIIYETDCVRLGAEKIALTLHS